MNDCKNLSLFFHLFPFKTCPPLEDSMLDVRPACKALKLIRGKSNKLIYNSMGTQTQRTFYSLTIPIPFYNNSHFLL